MPWLAVPFESERHLISEQHDIERIPNLQVLTEEWDICKTGNLRSLVERTQNSPSKGFKELKRLMDE